MERSTKALILSWVLVVGGIGVITGIYLFYSLYLELDITNSIFATVFSVVILLIVKLVQEAIYKELKERRR